jgi:hypothetical protein
MVKICDTWGPDCEVLRRPWMDQLMPYDPLKGNKSTYSRHMPIGLTAHPRLSEVLASNSKRQIVSFWILIVGASLVLKMVCDGI